MLYENPALPLLAAIGRGDLAEVEHLASCGTDLDQLDSHGDPMLFSAVELGQLARSTPDYERRFGIVGKLIDLGANPNGLACDGASVLIGPILGLHTEMIEFLLGRGVNPNHGCSEPWETMLDLALSDYCYEAWSRPSMPALQPPDDIVEEVDRLLAWLDQEARTRGYLPPEIPLLLRRHGALTGAEIAIRLGGRSDQSIVWTEYGWCLRDNAQRVLKR